MRGEPAPSKPDSDIERFDRWAPSYDQSASQKFFFVPIHSRMLALVASILSKSSPACVLDVGCGTGRLLRTASLRWPTARLYGVDPAPHMVSEAQRLNPNVSFQVAAAEALPFADATADIVFSSLSFHHWGDKEMAMREISRVLRAGGIFCLGDHTFPLAKLAGEKVKSRAEVRALMTGAGLLVLQQRNAGLPFVLITLSQR